MYMNVKQKRKQNGRRVKVGTLHGLEDEETGSIFAPATKCCTNDEGGYFAPKITKGDLICLAAIVLNESGMNRWCW